MDRSEELRRLERKVVRCTLCPRLVRWRSEVARARTARFAHETYWGKPVPSFGDVRARLLIVGLAPAAHGANRTGRMFTGDRSGEWLYRALHRFGFASSPVSAARDDGMKLTGCYITAAARCAPPLNKLDRRELENCRPFLVAEAGLLERVEVVIGLGRVAFDAAFDALKAAGRTRLSKRPAFGHGKQYRVAKGLTLIGSYHPSQQNTFTGRLTAPMFDTVFRLARKHLDS